MKLFFWEFIPGRDSQNSLKSEKKEAIEDSFRIYRRLGKTYWLLATLRILLTLIPQRGYIHPDEYFQSVEVIIGDLFNVEVQRAWEFNATFPIRSIAIPYVTYGLPLSLLQNIAPFLKFWFELDIRTPYLLLTLPRLSSCLLSFICDWCLYQICLLYGQNYHTRLLTFASSYVVLIYATRTFTNSIEMILTSLLLYYVSLCMSQSDKVVHQSDSLIDQLDRSKIISERVRLSRLRNALPSHSFTHAFTIASLTIIGIFNRPTFLAFAFPPVFFWLHRGLGSRTIGLGTFHLRVFLFAICTIPAIVILILIDSTYYGYLNRYDIGVLRISFDNFVVTPLNFLRYNTQTSNLAKHGLHSRFQHLVVNLPLLYNVLAFVAMFTLAKMVYNGALGKWTQLPKIQSIIGLMTASITVPVALLSIFPHQEPRFLIPITLPLVFLHAQRIRPLSPGEKSRKMAIRCWYILNIILTLFYGFIHQAGVYPLVSHMSNEFAIKPRTTAIHLVTSYLYSMPMAPLQMPNTKILRYDKTTKKRYKIAKQFFTYELGSESLLNITATLESLIGHCEKRWHRDRNDYQLYLAIPSSQANSLQEYVKKTKAKIDLVTIRMFYPHLSVEALLSEELKSTNMDDIASPFSFLSRISKYFGLSLVRIGPR